MKGMRAVEDEMANAAAVHTVALRVCFIFISTLLLLFNNKITTFIIVTLCLIFILAMLNREQKKKLLNLIKDQILLLQNVISYAVKWS